MGTVHEDQYTFSIISLSIILRKKVVEKITIHILCSIFFFFFENRAVYMKMWKNIVERGRSLMTIWRMHIARWIPKSTNAHS